MHAELSPEAGAGKLYDVDIPAPGELRILREARDASLDVDDEQRDRRRRFLSANRRHRRTPQQHEHNTGANHVARIIS